MWRHGTLRGVFRPSSRTLRHRASFVRRGCGGGGAGLHWRRYAPGSSAAPHGRPFLLAGGWEGERGESTTRTWGRGTTHNSQAGPPTRPSADASGHGQARHMRAGLCSLTFSVVVVYFGCCLVAADASLCVHLSSVSVRQFSRVFVPESRASISLQVDACVWYPTITGGFLPKVLFNCTGC